ncbi:MAG: hypothetical protein LBV33_08940, partial [Lachnospiraceae bacterium]|nr:hypothetical protein [Lachnospiraceae bacterium]
IEEPEKAAAELRRVARSMVILPISFTKGLRGLPRLMVRLYRLLGFAPKLELAAKEYKSFLGRIGFSDCQYVYIEGKIPMAVAVWKYENEKKK